MNKNTESLCRICLTQSKKMMELNAPLNIKQKDSPLVLEALEKVMAVKITCGVRYPRVICPMCLGLLKISYDLKLEFLSSEKILQAHFKDAVDPISLDDVKQNGEITPQESSVSSSVEIIVGSNKYDLKDLVIIEAEKEDDDNFKGFLNNLGKTVTAKLVNKSYKCSPKNFQEEPVVLIKKIETKNIANNVNIKKDKVRKTSGKVAPENVDQYIITEDDELSKSFDQTILKENVNLEEFGLENPTDIDQELFQSALNMQLKCDNCQKLYSSRSRFKKHLDICGKLEYQIIDDEKGQPTITSSPLLGCHICSRIFKQRKFLNYHVKTAHNEPSKYTCEICGHISRNRNSFMYHKLTKHGERKFICEICGKKFFTSSSLKIHTQNHTHRDVAQCVCPVCGKTFHYKGGLFYHMKLHTNERKYCCEFCDRKFYTLMAKKRHTLTHTGVRPYACKFCEKRFFSTGEVRKHEYLHTGFRPYRCQYCKKGFSSGYNMKVHLVSHPGPFMCKFCDKTFITSAVLQFHLKMKHPVTEENSFKKEEDSF